MSVFTHHGVIQGDISTARLQNGVPLNFAAQDLPPQLVAGPHVLVSRGEGGTALPHEADSISPLHHGSINLDWTLIGRKGPAHVLLASLVSSGFEGLWSRGIACDGK
jgi:hypothetical protein